jgi:hypothetical protein
MRDSSAVGAGLFPPAAAAARNGCSGTLLALFVGDHAHDDAALGCESVDLLDLGPGAGGSTANHLLRQLTVQRQPSPGATCFTMLSSTCAL